MLLAIVVIALAIWLISSCGNNRTGAETYTVPDLVGQTQSAAQTQLTNRHPFTQVRHLPVARTTTRCAAAPTRSARSSATDPPKGTALQRHRPVTL